MDQHNDRVGEVVERGDAGGLHEGEDELRDQLAQRPHGSSWRPAGREGEWRAEAEDGSKVGLIRTVAGAYEARVHRRPTGPTGPDPELSHGPQVFEDARDALDYAESQLGW